MLRMVTHADQRQPEWEPTDDVYCGIVSSSAWPFSDPLVVELVVARDSFFVKDVHINAPLTGLRRYVRQRVRGMPIWEAMYLPPGEEAGVYRADFFHCVEIALGLAVIEFKNDGDRVLDWMKSLRYSSRDLAKEMRTQKPPALKAIVQ